MAIPSFSKRLTIAVLVGLSAPWESGASQWLVPTLPGQPPVPPLQPPPASNPPQIGTPFLSCPKPLVLAPKRIEGLSLLGSKEVFDPAVSPIPANDALSQGASPLLESLLACSSHQLPFPSSPASRAHQVVHICCLHSVYLPCFLSSAMPDWLPAPLP